MTNPSIDEVSAEEHIEALAWRDLYLAAPADFVRRTSLGVESFGRGTAISLPTMPAVEFNRILGVRGSEDLSRAYEWIIARTDQFAVQIEEAALHGSERELLNGWDLQKNGNGWAKFTRDAEGLPLHIDGQVGVRIAKESEAEIFGATVCKGFGFPETLIPLWAAVVGRRGWSCMIASIDNEPIASGLLFVSEDTAWLGAGSTIKEYRNNGAQTALIKARLNEGFKQGAKRFAVETAQPEPGKEKENTSFTNMLKLGFSQQFTRANYKITQ